MKIHEDEFIERASSGEWTSWRTAVPGGCMYVYRMPDVYSVTSCFVPDPTAEHVTRGAGGAAAGAIYRDAVRAAYEKGVADILQAADEVLIEKGVGLVTRGMLAAKASDYRSAFRKSQTGEG